MSRRLLTWPLVVLGPALPTLSRFPQRALIGGCVCGGAAGTAFSYCLLPSLRPPASHSLCFLPKMQRLCPGAVFV